MDREVTFKTLLDDTLTRLVEEQTVIRLTYVPLEGGPADRLRLALVGGEPPPTFVWVSGSADPGVTGPGGEKDLVAWALDRETAYECVHRYVSMVRWGADGRLQTFYSHAPETVSR